MGGKTSKSTQQITIPPEVLARYNAINARADTVTNKPYQYYTGQFVAPLTETQRAGIAGTNAAAGMAQPYFAKATDTLNNAQAATQPYFDTAGQAYGAGLGQGQEYLGAATGYAQEGGQAVNASDLNSDAIQKYMSPYLQNVLQGTAGILNQQNQQQQSGQMGNAIRSGAFGGDRGGIAAANLNQQQNLANAQIFSNILNQGYNNALNTAIGQQAVGLGAAQANRAALQQTADRMAALGQQGFNQYATTGQNVQGLGKDVYGVGAATSAALAGLGTGAQNAALQGAAAQMTAGQAEQATQQAENTAKYNEFLQAQSLPYQQLKLAGDIALGTGTASGSTTTTAQPGGFFSDERLKENIKAVGKTFDGQTIHSFNYKGDPRTQIGLIAQEVQKHHPEAVGLAGGYKTVNYDKATEDAADRGHMASGGLASAGGSVMPQNAGQGFADGGLAGFDPAVMQQMLAAQQAMYAPITNGAIYAGGPNAGGGLVPQTELAARQLMTPAELTRQATGAEQAATIANLGKTVGELGGEVGAWDWGGEEAKKAGKTPVPTTGSTAPAATATTPPQPVDTSVPAPEEFSKDRKGPYAFGGGVPYGGQGLDIPTSGISAGPNSPMTASALQAQQSGLDKLSKVANVADTGMKLGKFGKKIGLFSTGGTPYGGQGLDIPEEDISSKNYQLPTAASMDKPESGLDKAAKIAQIAGTVAKVAGMISDKRMKENIKPIGKLFDGQIVHSYNYKGDPRTQIGLIAQEVEGHKPHAVGLAGKYKTVDYDKATSGAAKRGHFAIGGMPEAEMDDVPSYEPTGLYSGDNKFIRNLFKSTASGNKNIDLMSGEEMPAQIGEEAPKDAGFAKMAEPIGLAGAAKVDHSSLLQPKKPKEFAKPTGLMPVPASLPKDLSAISKLIFAAEGDGQAKTSSALGRYGIVKDTYVSYFKKAFPQQARELGDAGIKALRTTPEGRKLNLQFGPMIIADNAKHLQKHGFDTNARNVYLAHFLGPSGAVRALKAAPNTPVELAVNQESIDANPDVFAKRKIRTVGELLNWTGNTMAKRAKEIGFASGGVAGRDGYQVGGTPKTPEELLAMGMDPNSIPSGDPTKPPSDEERVQDIIAKTPIQDIAPATGTRRVGPLVEEPAKPAGLGVPVMATGADLARIGTRDAVMPDAAGVKVTGVAPPTGSPDTQVAAAPTPATEDNNFFRGLKKGKATSIIPLLSGIAAMGTAPTRSLGVALAAGVGAGAQAAQAQRAFGIKQGELAVAKQLADARTMEITKGILEKRYQFLENGQVFDTYTDTFLPTDLATIARGKAFQNGPMEAITGKTPGAVSRADYLRDNPTAGTKERNLPATTSYKANPSNPRETILAAGEFNPGVIDARADRNNAEANMKELYQQLSAPGIGPERYTQLSNLYNLAKIDYDKANTLWKETLNNVTASAITSLDAGNQALISVNAETLVPLIAAGQQAIRTKNTIGQMDSIVTQGGPLSDVLSKIGSGLKQAGLNSDLIDNILGAPDQVQQQNLLAGQLQLAGMDAAQIQAMRAGSSAQFERAAVRALLKNIEARADADIAAVQSANASFQSNPLKGNVPEKIIDTTERSFAESNAPIYRTRPAPGALPKGTPYKVLGDPKTYYAK